MIGQDHALERIAQAIRSSRANLTDPRRPIGVFMLAGTSGVGKTETAIALAEDSTELLTRRFGRTQAATGEPPE